jgi:hypothetical protein
MTPRTKHMAAGGVIGALALALGYSLYRSRKEILSPVLALPRSPHDEHEKHAKHKRRHDDREGNDRGEYGRKKRKHGEHERDS